MSEERKGRDDREREERRRQRLDRLQEFAEEVESWPSWKLRAGYAQPDAVRRAEARERLEARQRG